jgi:hypothetical protein
MGRKYYYPKKHKYRSSGSGGIASLIFSALSGRRGHSSYGYPRRSSSLKSSLLQYAVKAILKKVFK